MNKATRKSSLFQSELVWPFVLITSLFFLWGLANNMTDTLLSAFQRIMCMSDFQTSWIQMAFYGAYFCLALPAAILIKRYTYKTGILVGLGMFIAGALLFYPASITMSFGHFLIAIYILAGGLSVLETTANPYIVAMGPEASSTRRLNLAQSFNPIGSITGVLLSKFFILSQLNQFGAAERAAMSSEELAAVQSEELTAVMGPYVGVAVFLSLIWLLVKFTNMPRASDSGSVLHIGSSFQRLIRTRHYVWAVVAQFFYVGAQICVWSYTIRYAMQALSINEDAAATYYTIALVVFMASRFIFTGLMSFISPRALLLLTAVVAALLTFLVIYSDGQTGVYALIGISGCMSLMFPTIYAMGIKGLGEDTKLAGSGLIMAILGGAVLTSVQGYVSDATQNIRIAFYVPLACFALVAVYAAIAGKLEAAFRNKSVGDTMATDHLPIHKVAG
ncbi:L-fucose:H+ symporter permease [Pontibacter sp. SGAir0037]|uniref:L-fucose:H+ symporter permease n=1 Tax=Pontibacter sp. SGAir0037 TaxID=2571030 RepID=UPI0010CCFCFE|nr:L-fucose:H+ symporter permease [Pontibacter sp. SGAir0037]QCR22221.1 L-fucose:H+ symporter permease [Pontibacter sp. SGAir0037]